MAAHPWSRWQPEVEAVDPEAWARESAEIARTELHPPDLERGAPPPEGYRERAVELATRRVALAGYRLAAWLDDALGSGSGPDRDHQGRPGDRRPA